MENSTVAFVAYQDQDNLGVGYMASVLLEHGFRVASIDLQLGPDSVLSHLKKFDPVAIGISIIFQHQLYMFRDLIRLLRSGGLSCHLCAGGHYPSMRYGELLDFIPELDSVCLFEGESTFLELCDALRSGKDWGEVHGLAYRHDGNIKTTPLRPLIADLDTLPVPVRRPERPEMLGKRVATLMASRGCWYNCSFCSIRRFYSVPPGPLKRIRKPECVAAEMKYLYEELGCSIFLFQDDDFPLSGIRGREWISNFCDRLAAERLSDRILWKASCRPNEVDCDLFQKLRDHGLGWVYLGLESGTDRGLKLMNKHYAAKTGPVAVSNIKQMDLAYSFGFMLFDPGSTFDSVSENLEFLEEICGDGSAPITFCKMLPYAETPIEQQLKEAGRLIGDDGCLDYCFADPALDRYHAFLSRCFRDWIQDPNGVCLLGHRVNLGLAVGRKFFTTGQELDSLARSVSNTLAESNRFFLKTARDLMPWFQNGGYFAAFGDLDVVEESVATAGAQYRGALQNAMSAVQVLAERATVST